MISIVIFISIICTSARLPPIPQKRKKYKPEEKNTSFSATCFIVLAEDYMTNLFKLYCRQSLLMTHLSIQLHIYIVIYIYISNINTSRYVYIHVNITIDETFFHHLFD